MVLFGLMCKLAPCLQQWWLWHVIVTNVWEHYAFLNVLGLECFR
jgi:hypothetical protein